MPELPEVETVRRGLERSVVGARIAGVEVRESRLRVPVPVDDVRILRGRSITAVDRRAKYLILRLDHGALLVHLGMSGSLRLAEPGRPLHSHDHVRFRLASDRDGEAVELRYRDPRRFGLVVPVTSRPVEAHPRLRHLGPEPLSPDFDGGYLRRAARGSRRPIKNLLMDGRRVAGIGNIYASEALWRARINPRVAAERISVERCQRLCAAIREVLEDAIEEGGTTLDDFRDTEGEPGYFRVRLAVYGRDGEPCRRCDRPLRRIVQAGRSTYYCTGCQH